MVNLIFTISHFNKNELDLVERNITAISCLTKMIIQRQSIKEEC